MAHPVKVEPEHNYLAINGEHADQYAEISTNHFDKCKILGTIHLCTSVVAVSTNTSSSCLMTLFSHNHKQALRLCKQSIVPAVDSVLPIGDNRFLSYTKCTTCTYSVTCANKTSIGKFFIMSIAVKKCQNLIFEVNFQRQKSSESFF